MGLEATESRLQEWIAAANTLALLRSVHASGMFSFLHELSTIEAVAEKYHIDVTHAQRICMVLQTLEIVQREGSEYRLTDAWIAIASDDHPALLANRLRASVYVQNAIESCLDLPVGFQAVSSEEAISLARIVWGEPASPIAQNFWASIDDAMPEVKAVWERGGRHAEYGCGAGRDLLRVVLMYERVSAVGYELKPEIAAITSQQARDLGQGRSIKIRPIYPRNRISNPRFSALFRTKLPLICRQRAHRPTKVARTARQNAKKPGN